MENVKEIERLVKEGLVIPVNGKYYSACNLKTVVDERAVKTIGLNTLTGLVNYLNTNIDKLNVEELLCIVNGHDEVSLVSKIISDTRSRDNVINVNLMEDGHEFDYGQFVDHETFCIKLKSLFVLTPDLTNLIQFVSKLKIENSIGVEDDGITQSATVKKGMSGALFETMKSPAVVNLKPYRTFNEIEQPESNFLFRMRTDHNKNPQCALFEADGGAWRFEAMELIKGYLSKEVKGLTVIA